MASDAMFLVCDMINDLVHADGPNGTTGYAITAYSKAGARTFVITKSGTGVAKTATDGGKW